MNDQSIILITQRIDEAENICDHIALMNNGKFKDFGTPGFLKTRHGKGYQLKVELASTKFAKEVDHIIHTKMPFCKRIPTPDLPDTSLVYSYDDMKEYSSADDSETKHKMAYLFKQVTTL